MSSTMSGDDGARVVLIGQGPTALSALRSLLAARIDVAALVRNADEDDATVRLAARHAIPVHADTALPAVEALVDRLGPDCVVVSSYDRLLPERMLGERPFVNVHYAPLPRYRGRANVNWMVLNGEPEAAVTVHSMVPGLDAGGVLFQRCVPIGPRDTVADVYRTLNDIQEQHLASAVTRRLSGDEGTAQDAQRASYGCTRVPEDGEIDWTMSTSHIDRQVRALTDPFPAFTFCGLTVLQVLRAEPVNDPPRYEGRVCGRVVKVSAPQGFVDVLTGDGVLRLHEVRLGAGQAVPASEVVRSVRQTLGVRTTDLVRKISELEARLVALSEGKA